MWDMPWILNIDVRSTVERRSSVWVVLKQREGMRKPRRVHREVKRGPRMGF